MKTCIKNHQYDDNLKCCPECRKLSNLAWYAKNKEKSISRSLERYHSNKEEIKKQRKISNLNKTPEQKRKSRDRKNKYRRERYANDINFRLSLKLRARISRTIKSHSESLTNNFGCTIDELKTHLQSKFLPGMTWDNYGKHGWHIDHIKPLENFDLTREDEVKKACKYTNLLPRWASDNHKKSNKTLITIVTGAPGAGKSWVANQLDRTKWNVVDSDVVPKKELVDRCISDLSTVLFLTIGVSTFMKNDRFHYDLIVIDEPIDVLKSRVLARGGKITPTIERRYKRMQSLKTKAKFTGSSQEVIEYLS
jgi:hypothetical protein